MYYIDLHRHLEGSIRPETVYEYFNRINPQLSLAKIRKSMQVDGSEKTLMDFILKLGTKFMKEIVKSEEELERFAYEAVEDAANQGIDYLELRACPLPIYQAVNDVTPRKYINAVRRGMIEAEKDYEIKTGLVVSFKREDTFEENRMLAQDTIAAFERGIVCGADLCGNEPKYPTKRYAPLFDLLADADIPFTIHAGEADTSESIKQAVELGASRIGHATNLYQDKELMKRIKDEGIGLECCVTSNIHTKNVATVEAHPIRKYYDYGMKVTFNSDDPVTSAITIGDEAKKLIDQLGFLEIQLEDMVMHAADIAFLDVYDELKI